MWLFLGLFYAELKKQMDILIDLKTAFNQQRDAKGNSPQDSKEDASISCTISCEEDSVKDRAEEEPAGQDISIEDDLERSGELGQSMRLKTDQESKLRTLSGRAFNCQGKNLRINIPLTTPSRTFSAISYLLWEDVNQSAKGSKLNINKTKLHHAEKMIKGALIELYKGLGYLKTYRNLNMLAFLKILKKFDKVTGKQVLPIYLKVVESSYFNSSDKEYLERIKLFIFDISLH